LVLVLQFIISIDQMKKQFSLDESLKQFQFYKKKRQTKTKSQFSNNIQNFNFNMDRTHLFVDAGYLEATAKKRNFKINYVEFIQVLERILQCSFQIKWYFTSTINQQKLEKLESVFVVKNYDFKQSTCPNCNEIKKIQKGVDVAIATQISKAAIQNLCDRIVIVTGDGDFDECLQVSTGEFQKELTIIGFNDHSMSHSLRQHYNVVYLDSFIPLFSPCSKYSNNQKQNHPHKHLSQNNLQNCNLNHQEIESEPPLPPQNLTLELPQSIKQTQHHQKCLFFISQNSTPLFFIPQSV